MKIYAKHSALFFLFIFTAYLISGIAIKGVAYYASFSSSETAWETTCQNATHVAHISHTDKTLSTTKNFPSKNQQPVERTNCSSSLQVLPVSNTFLLEPVQKDRFIYNIPSFLTSQIFASQEPDPPQLG